MDLRSRVGAALKDAMRAKDAKRLSTLRLINAAIKDRDIAMRGEGDDGGAGDAEVLAILARMVKQRQESVRLYEEGGRLDMAEEEREEIEIVEEFLPRQLDEQEVTAAIDEAVADTSASGIRDMGRVMATLKERYAGRMDFGQVGPRVKQRLAG
jgi:uncharacterized protein YqeY